MNKTQKKISIALLVVVLLSIQFYLNHYLRRTQSAWIEPPVQQDYKWNTELFKTITLGHWAVGVDWLWMRTLQDDAIYHVPKGKHPRSFYDLDLATDIDQAFYEVYLYGAPIISVIRDDGEGARDLLLKAENFITNSLPLYSDEFTKEFWPKRWYLMLTLAYVYMFDLGDLPNASSAFTRAAQLPGAPKFLLSLGEKLKTVPGQYSVAIKLLAIQIKLQKDPVVKEELQKKRRSLFLGQYIYEVNDAFQKYLTDKNILKDSHRKLRRAWVKFKKENRIASVDPWGGVLKVDPSGKILTTTKYKKVFQMEY